MAELPEHESRRIREYVNSQSPADDQAGLVQKIGSRRILHTVHHLYDVHCVQSRWWVITGPTNLYSQEAFPEVEQAFIFHLGLGFVVMQRSRTEIDEEVEEHVSGAWRRYSQAVDAMDTASEAEDFQAIGIQCREAMIALARDHAGDERLADGRLRSYVKALVDKTWDLAVWLQHYADATPDDADIVLDATNHLLGTLGGLLHRRERGPLERQVVEEPEQGYLAFTVCGACGWRSDGAFTSWAEHFKDADIEGYLNGPTTGISDRLHTKDRRRERVGDDS